MGKELEKSFDEELNDEMIAGEAIREEFEDDEETQAEPRGGR